MRYLKRNGLHLSSFLVVSFDENELAERHIALLRQQKQKSTTIRVDFWEKSKKSWGTMAIPNVDKLYECGSVLSTAKATDFPKVRLIECS